ncbi:restriction endonuclease subunit S [Streptomyces fagopyri]|uniref:restriction endonuclease subunit S n=1 Tax=Streptomyces fagopyri TaxID=2662397 RepID=UPI0033FD50CA
MSTPLLPLRRVFKVINGGTPTPDEINWDGDVPWATPADFGPQLSSINTTRRTLSGVGVRTGSTVVPQGALLISTRAPVGYVAVASQAMAFNQGCRALVPHASTDTRFFGYQLEAKKSDLQAEGLGTTFLELSSDKLAAFRVHVPSFEEQRRIADFLDAETARIDGLTQLRSRQADLLDERCGLALDEAFQKSTYEPTRLKYLLAIKPRYGVLVPQFSDSGVRFIRVNDLLDLPGRAESLAKIPDELSAQYARTVTRPGDVLLSVVGTMGRSAVVPSQLAGANVARAVASLRARRGVSPELLATWLTTPSFLRQALDATGSDTAQPTLGMEDLSKFKLSWPVDERGREELLLITSTIRRHQRELTGVLEAQRRVLAERRQALITAAVTGQFDVSTASGRNVTDGVTA